VSGPVRTLATNRLMKNWTTLLLIALAAVAIAAQRSQPNTETGDVKTANSQFTVVPIGRIAKEGERTFIRLEARHRDGLRGLEEWSHIWVFYWFDRNDTPERRSILQVHPHGNRENPLTGVFATRSPMRPNLIALSLCRVLSVKGTDIEIENIDAFDQTPVIDLKPYSPGLDRPQGKVSVPKWAGPPTGPPEGGPNSDAKRP
jgi:tRNA-Thr(GGU) m(6)t(6)A37 methyltransferase TsaA